MALIECPKCMKEISDSANKCPHCGCEFHQNTQGTICPECGENVLPNTTPCPKCGYPIKIKKRLNKGLIGIILLVTFLLIVVMGLVFFYNNSRRKTVFDEKGHVYGMEWGTSKDNVNSVIEKFGGKLKYDGDYYTDGKDEENFCGFTGFEAYKRYNFNSKGLDKVIFLISEHPGYSVSETYNELKKVLENKYGESSDLWDICLWYTDDTMISLWKDDLFVIVGFEKN